MSCGLPYVVFMLPDFCGLRKQSSAIALRRSSEHSHRLVSNKLQSFLQVFSGNVPLTSCKKLDSCDFSPKSTAHLADYQSVQTDSTHTSLQLAPPVFAQRDYQQLFFRIWIEQPSWSPIILTKYGWVTVKSRGQSKVPLTLGSIQSHYKRYLIIGKRFGKLTNYLMIDIDINSPYHPRNQGLAVILAAMEELGLCRYLIVRSSASGGLHIYFPLAQPVKAWALACAAHSALAAHGVSIVGGQCELFPNKKAFNAEHNGHRLPLHNGSFLLDEDFCPVRNHKADFVLRWQAAAALQDEQRLQQAIAGHVVYATDLAATSSVSAGASDVVEVSPTVTTPLTLHSKTSRTHHVIPPIVWKRFGQSNDIMRELVNYGDRYVGLNNAADLAAWVKTVAPQLPGYQKFASPKSKQDIEQGNWAWRWAKAHFESAWKYRTGGVDHNAKVKADARWRIFAALNRVCVDVNIGVTALWKCLSAISESCFDKGIAWQTFTKYRDEIIERIKGAGGLGLSRSDSEDVNSFSEERLKAEVTEENSEPRKAATQLLTHRCVIAIYSSVFSLLDTSQNQEDSRGGKTAISAPKNDDVEVEESQSTETDDFEGESELVEGQQVRITMPGGSLDGLETHVVERTVDSLGQRVYRLDYQRQGRAVTLPAECLQILGRHS